MFCEQSFYLDMTPSEQLQQLFLCSRVRRSFTTFSIIWAPKKMHMVAWCCASLEIASVDGLGVFTPGLVLSQFERLQEVLILFQGQLHLIMNSLI
ncbi:MAG: hypothetical protein NKF70_02385 [Methanobacterium sp. ERen5]|nr:MAG: hypothetical protein NKF70_02385 [Methanobacterium sp. ERen5]